MTTIDDTIGFEHRVAATGIVATSVPELWSGINGDVTYVTGRDGIGYAARFNQVSGTATYARHPLPQSQRRIGSGYFWRNAGNPSSSSTICQLGDTGSTTLWSLQLTTAGIIRLTLDGGATWTNASVAISDNIAHRFDFDFNSSANPWTMDWAIDGVAQTQVTQASAAVTSEKFYSGSVSTTMVADIVWDDWAFSVTPGDYPIGPHRVAAAYVDGEGSDSLGSTNPIIDEASGQTTLYTSVQTWPPDGSTYITYTSTTLGDAATHYAEVTFANKNAALGTIIGVNAIAAIWAQNTTANAGVTRIVDSANTTLVDVYSGDQSQNTVRYTWKIVPAPGAGWAAGFNGVKGRVGFSTDTNPLPRWSGLMLEYVTTASEDINLASATAVATGTAGVGVPKLTVAGQAATATAMAPLGVPATGGPPIVVLGVTATATAYALAHQINTPVGRVGEQQSMLGNIVLGEPGLAPILTVAGVTATATAAGVTATTLIEIPGLVADATGVANVPPFMGDTNPIIGVVATATADAMAPTMLMTISGVTALADAIGLPGLIAGSELELGGLPASATADAFVPTIDIEVLGVPAEAFAEATLVSFPTTPNILLRGHWQPRIMLRGRYQPTIKLRGRLN